MYLSAPVQIISGVLSKVVKMSLGVVCNHFYISCIDVSPHFNKWCISTTDGLCPLRLFFWAEFKKLSFPPNRHGTNTSFKLLLNIVFSCSVHQMGGINLLHPESLAQDQLVITEKHVKLTFKSFAISVQTFRRRTEKCHFECVSRLEECAGGADERLACVNSQTSWGSSWKESEYSQNATVIIRTITRGHLGGKCTNRMFSVLEQMIHSVAFFLLRTVLVKLLLSH